MLWDVRIREENTITHLKQFGTSLSLMNKDFLDWSFFIF